MSWIRPSPTSYTNRVIMAGGLTYSDVRMLWTALWTSSLLPGIHQKLMLGADHNIKHLFGFIMLWQNSNVLRLVLASLRGKSCVGFAVTLRRSWAVYASDV